MAKPPARKNGKPRGKVISFSQAERKGAAKKGLDKSAPLLPDKKKKADPKGPPHNMRGARKRLYSQEQMDRAKEVFEEHGMAWASRQTGIPRTTIGLWVSKHEWLAPSEEKQDSSMDHVQKARARYIAHTRQKVKELFLESAEMFLEEVQNVDHYDPKDRKDLIMAAAISLDKFRLEMGEATDRFEHTHRDETLKFIENQLDELEARRKERAALEAGVEEGELVETGEA